MTALTLELVLALTGGLSFTFSAWALLDSGQERSYLKSTRTNGLKWATVNAHLARDLARTVASSILCAAGVWLLCLPDDYDVPALVAKHALMFMGWCMIVSVWADRIMRERVRVHLERVVDKPAPEA